MSIRQLKTFLAVADTGSFAAAAEQLGLTHSAVSVQIRNLEQEFGATLFDRSRKPPTMSEAGRLLVPQVRDIVAKFDGLAAGVRDGGSLAGEVRLGSVGSVLTGLLPRVLAALRTDIPGLHVSLTSGLTNDLVAKVRDGQLDAAVVSDFGAAGGDLVWRPFLSEPLVLVAPGDAPDEPVAELIKRYPFIRYAPDASVGRVIDAAIRAARLRVSEQMQLDWIEAIEAMVASGLGVSVIPKRICAGEHRQSLKTLPFGKEQRYRTLGLVERRGHNRSHLADVLFTRLEMAGESDVK